jgi:very-short-patch-repair endonuclease
MDKRIIRSAKPESLLEDKLLGSFEEFGIEPKMQYPISVFFADFCFPEQNLIIEVDGHNFHLNKEREDYRKNRLISLGWRLEEYPGWAIYRFHRSIAAKIALQHFKDKLSKEQKMAALGAVTQFLKHDGADGLVEKIISEYKSLL